MNKQVPLTGLIRIAAAGAFALVIAGCNTEGQDPLQPQLEMSISAPQVDSDTPYIPIFTGDDEVLCSAASDDVRHIQVRISRSDGSGAGDLGGTEVQGAIEWLDEGRAILSRFPDPDENGGGEDDNGDDACGSYVAVPVELTADTATFIIAGTVSGTVRFRASMAADGVSLSETRTFDVGNPTTLSGDPAGTSILVQGPTPRRIPSNSPQQFSVTVLNEDGKPVADSKDSYVTIAPDSESASSVQLGGNKEAVNQDELELPTSDGMANFYVTGLDGIDTTNLDIQAFHSSGEAMTDVQIAVGQPDEGPQITTSNAAFDAIAPGATVPPDWAFEAISDSGPYTWSLEGGMLPDGMALDDAGILKGTVSEDVETGRYVFRVHVEDNQGRSDSQEFSIDVEDD